MLQIFIRIPYLSVSSDFLKGFRFKGRVETDMGKKESSTNKGSIYEKFTQKKTILYKTE
jgi:hypothetical protein